MMGKAPKKKTVSVNFSHAAVLDFFTLEDCTNR